MIPSEYLFCAVLLLIIGGWLSYWLRASNEIRETTKKYRHYRSKCSDLEKELSDANKDELCSAGGNLHNFVDKFDEEPVLLVQPPKLDLTAVPDDELITDVMEQFGTLVQECTEKKKTYVQSMCTRCGKVVNRNQTGVSLRKDS